MNTPGPPVPEDDLRALQKIIEQRMLTDERIIAVGISHQRQCVEVSILPGQENLLESLRREFSQSRLAITVEEIYPAD